MSSRSGDAVCLSLLPAAGVSPTTSLPLQSPSVRLERTERSIAADSVRSIRRRCSVAEGTSLPSFSSSVVIDMLIAESLAAAFGAHDVLTNPGASGKAPGSAVDVLYLMGIPRE